MRGETGRKGSGVTETIRVTPGTQRQTGTLGSMTYAAHFPPNGGAESGIGPLIVCDDCLLPPQMMFPMHTHRDDEIVSYVRSGELVGIDEEGGRRSLRRGWIGVMSAGRGKSHEEWVPLGSEPVRMYQIAIRPRQVGLEPLYRARDLNDGSRAGRYRLLVSPDGAEGSMTIYQDVRILDVELQSGESVAYDQLDEGRVAWLTVQSGEVRLGAWTLREGDAVTINGLERFDVRAETSSELLLFDLDPNAPAADTGTLSGR